MEMNNNGIVPNGKLLRFKCTKNLMRYVQGNIPFMLHYWSNLIAPSASTKELNGIINNFEIILATFYTSDTVVKFL